MANISTSRAASGNQFGGCGPETCFFPQRSGGLTSAVFSVENNPVVLTATDIPAGQTVAVEITANGTTWETWTQNAKCLCLQRSNNRIVLCVPGQYRLRASDANTARRANVCMTSAPSVPGHCNPFTQHGCG